MLLECASGGDGMPRKCNAIPRGIFNSRCVHIPCKDELSEAWQLVLSNLLCLSRNFFLGLEITLCTYLVPVGSSLVISLDTN